jgi:hypothetical protein
MVRSPSGPRRSHPPQPQPKGMWQRFRRLSTTAKTLTLVGLSAAVTTAVGYGVTTGLDSVRSADVPFTWSVKTPPLDPCFPNVVIGKSEQEARPPNDMAQFPAWARQVKPAPGSPLFITTTLQGRSEKAVVLLGMRAKVNRSAAPQAAFGVGGGCGGGISPRAFTVALDEPIPRFHPKPGAEQIPQGPGKPAKDRALAAVNFPYRISATEPEVFQIRASAEHCDCQWTFEVEWSSGGETGWEEISDNGRPFHTVSALDKPYYVFDVAGKEWARVPN